jgi:hypothetical protein
VNGTLIMSLMIFKYVSKGQREISPNGMRVCEVPKYFSERSEAKSPCYRKSRLLKSSAFVTTFNRFSLGLWKSLI